MHNTLYNLVHTKDACYLQDEFLQKFSKLPGIIYVENDSTGVWSISIYRAFFFSPFTT